MLVSLLGNQAELEQALSGIDLADCSVEAREQFQQELAMLLNRQKPDRIQFYAPLFNKESILSYLPPGFAGNT